MSEIASPFFREGHHYSYDDIKKAFRLDDDVLTKKQINTLKRFNVLKQVRVEKPDYSELSDLDLATGDVPEDSTSYCYQFTFVGVILLGSTLIKCYPKYLDTNDSKKQFDELKTVLKVIETFNAKEQVINLYNGNEEDKTFNKLVVSLHILRDYLENGLYSTQQEIAQLNGDGEILWEKTINETFAFIKNKIPYYLSYYTVDNTENDFDYIRRLHGAIVTECSKMLKQYGMIDLFNLQEAELSEQSLDDFGDGDYIKYRLESEIKKQFVTRKQNLLKTLYTYISESRSSESNYEFSLYGTNAFNLIWEKACGKIFGNEYESLEEEIPQPQWYIGDSPKPIPTETLIPDIVTKCNLDKYNEVFCILDGKYYLIYAEGGKLHGNPGVQDVVKQFVYHKAFLDYIFSRGQCSVFNAFLFPMVADSDCSDDVNVFGHVTMMDWGVETLVPLYLIFLKPSFVWDAYLNDKECKDKLLQILKSPQLQKVFWNVFDSSQVLYREKEEKAEKTLTMVGYLKRSYFDFIADETLKRDGFLFYFYRTKDGFKYPVHPDLKYCKNFIGYTDDCRIICGEISKNVSVLDAESLQSKLCEQGFVNAGCSAKDYFVAEIRSFKLDDSITLEKLQDKVESYAGNDITNPHSPKVIENF